MDQFQATEIAVERNTAMEDVNLYWIGISDKCQDFREMQVVKYA